MIRLKIIQFLPMVFLCLLLACGSAQTPGALPTATATPRNTPGMIPGEKQTSPTFTIPSEPSPTSPPTTTHTATSTKTLVPTATASQTPVPTYVKLRGKVIIDQAICHYGPGAPYLYKYGVYKDSNLELLRRLEGGNYIEIQAIGGNNPCWVRVDYFEIKGNVNDLQPVRIDEVKLPISPYYASPGGVSARRDGDVVTVFWHPLALRAGDDSEQVPYIVEAWVCQGGQMVFVPAGAYQAAVEITDETGCSEPSHAWFIAAEKHGYTPRVAVPWPSPATTPPAP